MTSSLIINLIRPQYAPNSEVLVSSLVNGVLAPESSAPKGLRFLNRDPESVKEVTGPVTSEQKAVMAAGLQARGVQTGDTDSVELVEAIVRAVTGVASAKGTSLPVSPMTEHLALMQDLRGVLGTSNPPNLGRALETMFRLGAPAGLDPENSMASLWLSASRTRKAKEPLLEVIDQVFAESHRCGPFHKRQGDWQVQSDWDGRFPESPFGWLHASWTALMDPRWVDRLPTRVWTDWATAVLRTALGFGYLAEMRWYELLGRCLLSEDSVDELPTLRGEQLLPWPAARLPVQSRNVKSEIKQLVNRGTGVLAVLREWEVEPRCSGLQELEALRQREEVRAAIRVALGGTNPPSFAKNTYETVIYALQQRGGGSGVDYYGLLKSHGTRYSVVDPGTEWIAVLASLACDLDTRETNVGTVMKSLGRLGMSPELQELVKVLEAAGMAQGSADADHGVRVRSAF